jgi:tetratricopeptide (TPR) repeat protein
MRLLASQNVIKRESGLWQVEKGVDFKIPSSTKEIFLRRLERLSNEDKRLLDFGSVIGNLFNPLVIAISIGLEENVVNAHLDSIAVNTFLIEKVEAEYRFSHDKIRRVNYERLSHALRKELHERIGTTLEELPHDDRILGELSTHFYESGMDDKCIEYSILAGKRFNSYYAGVDGLVFFTRAIEKLGRDTKEDSRWREAIEGLGDSHYQAGDYRRAFDQYDVLLTVLPDGNERARLLRKCADCWMPQKLGEGSGERHSEYLSLAMKCKDVSRREWAEILRDAAVEAAWRGDFEDDDRMSREAISILMEEGDFVTAAWEMSLHGFSLMSLGRNNEAVERLKEAEQYFKQRPWPRGEIDTALNLGQAFTVLGEEGAAIESLQRCITISAKLADFYSAAWAYLNLSIIEHFRSDDAKAAIFVEKARKSALVSGNKNLVAMMDAFLIVFSLKMTNIQRAKECRDEMEGIVRRYDLTLKSPLWGISKIAQTYYDFLVGDSLSSDFEFEQGLSLLDDAQVGYLYQGIGTIWWADALRQKGQREASKLKFEEGISRFAAMSNSKQVERIQNILSEM